MKYQKSLLILIISFVSLQICFGQEKSKAILVDEFSKITCDDLLARVDNLAIQLNNKPDSIAYIITFGKKNQTLSNFQYEQLLKNSLIALRRDKSRYVFVHGADGDDLSVQFWVVPVVADKPEYIEGNWGYEIEARKPFIFYATKTWQDGICPAFPDLELFSKFLQANQNLRGNIVVFEKNLRRFRQKQKELSNELVIDDKVQRSRIKFFFVKEEFSNLEFWLVPHKKK